MQEYKLELVQLQLILLHSLLVKVEVVEVVQMLLQLLELEELYHLILFLQVQVTLIQKLLSQNLIMIIYLLLVFQD